MDVVIGKIDKPDLAKRRKFNRNLLVW